MFRLDADRPVHFCDGMKRRDFLHAGALSFLGFGLTELFGLKALGAVDTSKDVNCIMLFLVGGPSQLDTWDPKPNAPAEIRGPYKAVKTNVAGIEITEIFERIRKHADKYALVRTLNHSAAAVQDTGHQMIQTGRPFFPQRPFWCVAIGASGTREGIAQGRGLEEALLSQVSSPQQQTQHAPEQVDAARLIGKTRQQIMPAAPFQLRQILDFGSKREEFFDFLPHFQLGNAIVFAFSPALNTRRRFPLACASGALLFMAKLGRCAPLLGEPGKFSRD